MEKHQKKGENPERTSSTSEEAYVLIHSGNSSDCTEKGKEPRMS